MCLQDDMPKVYPRLLEADIIILASPIFFYGVTGWAKALIDRCQALWARKYELKDPDLGREGKKTKGILRLDRRDQGTEDVRRRCSHGQILF